MVITGVRLLLILIQKHIAPKRITSPYMFRTMPNMKYENWKHFFFPNGDRQKAHKSKNKLFEHCREGVIGKHCLRKGQQGSRNKFWVLFWVMQLDKSCGTAWIEWIVSRLCEALQRHVFWFIFRKSNGVTRQICPYADEMVWICSGDVNQSGSVWHGERDGIFFRCRNRARVGLSVGISVTLSVPCNKVRVVIVLTKNFVKIINLVL